MTNYAQYMLVSNIRSWCSVAPNRALKIKRQKYIHCRCGNFYNILQYKLKTMRMIDDDPREITNKFYITCSHP